MSQRWFVTRGEHVYGPWTTEDVRSHHRSGNVSDQDVIWGFGESVWVSLSRWNPEQRATPASPAKPTPAHVEPVIAPARTEPARQPTPAPALAEPTRAKAEAVQIRAESAEPTVITTAPVSRASDEETFVGTFGEVTVIAGPRVAREAWHYAREGQSFGPFPRAALLVELRRVPDLAGVSLWTTGMKEWAPIFEFEEIARELNANQRQFVRAAISGQAKLIYDGLNHVVPLVSIGEGGIGVALDSGVFAGQTIALEIQSDQLAQTIATTAAVRYRANGICGLKFEDLESGSRAIIARYVKHHAAREAKAA